MALRTSLVAQPHLYMGDTQGRPLDAGKVYFGEPNKDPELYPISVYYDEALTIAAPQPIRTMGGFMNANGQMVEIYAAETTYSVKVLDGYGRQVFYQENMSSTSTSTSISTRLPYLGAVTRIQADVNSEHVSLEDFKLAGRTDEQSLTYALTSGAKELLIPYGKTYTISTQVIIENPTVERIYGGGEIVFEDTGLLWLKNTLTPLSPDSTNNYSGVTKLKFSSVANIDVDDIIIIWNPTDYSLSAYRDIYRDGYMTRVASKDATTNTVQLYGRTPRINASAINAYKFKNKPICIDGIKIRSNHSKTTITLTHFAGVDLIDIKSPSNLAYVGIKVEKCYDINVDNIRNAANTRNAYPVHLSNCQDFRIRGCSTASIRHAIGIGGDGFEASVPSRNGIVSHCTLVNDPSGAAVGVPSGDAHGNALNVRYDNCTLNMGAQFGGRDCSLYNCDIYSMGNPNSGVAVVASELIGGLIKMYDCTLFMSRDSVEGSRNGVIKISCASRTEELHIDIKNLSIDWLNETSTLSAVLPLVLVQDSDTAKDMFITLDGVHEINSKVKKNEIVRVYKDTNNTAATIYVTIDNITKLNYSKYCTGTMPQTQFKYRITGNSGRSDVVAQPGATVSDIKNIPLGIEFPKTAAVQMETFENFTYGTKGWFPKARFTSVDGTLMMQIRLASIDSTNVSGAVLTMPVEWTTHLREF